MCREILKANLFDEQKSNHVACRVLKQATFLSTLAEKLESDPASIVQRVESFRAQCTFYIILFAIYYHCYGIIFSSFMDVSLLLFLHQIVLSVSTFFDVSDTHSCRGRCIRN
jgi:hypothetical protein